MSVLEYIAFVVVTLFFYYLLPRKTQSAVLIFASIFYSLSIGLSCFVSVLGVTMSAFFFARKAEQKKSRRALALYIAIILSSLVFSRILTMLDGASLIFRVGSDGSVGVAFYSLSAVGYLVDVYRGKIKAEKSFLRLFLFVGFFPCLSVGPILRYGNISRYFTTPHPPSWSNITSGALRVSYGYFKKLVISDTALVAVKEMVAYPERYGGGYVFFLVIIYSVVIYADFTGGVDVALGIGRMLGIALPENFDRPFASSSVREYWKRWHITLGAFFSDYVFYPLSVSKPVQRLSRRIRQTNFKKLGRRIPVYFALIVTWLLTGVWHGFGVNFILWGVTNAILIILLQECSQYFTRNKKTDKPRISDKALTINKPRNSDKAFKADKPRISDKAFKADKPRISDKALKADKPRRRSRPLAAAKTFLIIGAVRLFDLWGDALTAPRAVLSIFYDLGAWKRFFSDGVLSLGLDMPRWVLILFGVALMYGISQARASVKESFVRNPFAVTLSVAALTLATVIFGSYGAGFDEASFIYSQF